MSRLLSFQVLCLVLLSTGGAAFGSTMAARSIPCSYRNVKHPSLNIRGMCQVQYGVIGHTGQGYRRVRWPDGVMTLIKISAGGASQESASAMIDESHSSALLTCGHEIYNIGGNSIELIGNLRQ
jgi:hypothetical protein